MEGKPQPPPPRRGPHGDGAPGGPPGGATPHAASPWPLLWGALFLLAFVLIWMGRERPGRELSYSELKQELRADNVDSVTFEGRKITGLLRKPPPDVPLDEADAARRFVSRMPVVDDPELLTLLERQRVSISAEPESEGWWSTLLVMALPLVVILALFLYGGSFLRRQMGGMGDRLTGFGQSRARRFEKGMSDVGFDDVAGLDNAKQELMEIVDFLKDPSRFRKLGAEVPRGVLLLGPPGTGKTLLARAVAGEADVPFFSITGSEFVEMFVGVGASRVRDMFATAKKEAPAILFIDEIDSVGRVRGTGVGGSHDEREQTLNQILSEMDGFSQHEAVVVVAATNRPDVLDPALLRPGRFDRKITLELPQRAARRKILQIHSRHVPLAEDVDLDDLAARTVGFSGADLENLVNEAALLAVREARDRVDREHFERARDRILLGSEREDLIIEKEKRGVAYHEAGHALVARLLPGTDPLKKVTIIPRGRALGATEQMPEEDRHNFTRSYLEGRIAVLLGGRVAERLVFKDVTTGAESDLKQVTALARRMVTQWGMSERLGLVAFRHGEEHPFLGREMSLARDYSEHTAQLIDQEVRRVVADAELKAEQVLTENRQLLDRLAEALLVDETLDADEIEEVLQLVPLVARPEPEEAPTPA